MSEETKRGRKPTTPSLDSIRKAVERGEYDEHLHDLDRMIQKRRDELKETVLARVRDVFGSDAEVVVKEGEGIKANSISERKNPFIEKVREQESPEDGQDVEYRIDPRDGNAYRIDDRTPPETPIESPETSDRYFWICDVLGGHRQTVLKSMWNSWAISGSDNQKSDPAPGDILPKLDEVEQDMAREGSSSEPQPIQQPVDIERRGASISGLHPSDMGGA
jgi:hypothetical protein